MNKTYTKISRNALSTAVAELVRPIIEKTLDSRGPGHCIRVNDLHEEVLESVCSELRRVRPDGKIFILGSDNQENQLYRVTSAKLVQLRNSGSNDESNQPLLVFIPASHHTSAEDSFSAATFEELPFENIYELLISSLFERLQDNLVDCVRVLFKILKEKKWLYANDIARARYLLSVLANGADTEALGASLFELALVPDFKLFDDPELEKEKIYRNLKSVSTLTNPNESTLEKISDLKVRENNLVLKLFLHFENFDIQEPQLWTFPIAIDNGKWDISFDKWLFQEEISQDKIKLSNVQTNLPTVKNKEVDNQVTTPGEIQVLDRKKHDEFMFEFEVQPHPLKVGGLTHFTAEIVSEQDDVVVASKNIQIWKKEDLKKTVRFLKLDTIKFKKGRYFIRIKPRTADRDLIPMVEDFGIAGSNPSNESDYFYVTTNNDIKEEAPKKVAFNEQSLEHAYLQLHLTAMAEGRDPAEVEFNNITWMESGKSKIAARQSILLAQFSRKGAVRIQVSHELKTIEKRILENTKHLTKWEMKIKQDVIVKTSHSKLLLPSSDAMDSFLAAREAFFTSMNKDVARPIMQALSLQDSEVECIEYAESYLALVKSLMDQAEDASGSERLQALKDLRNILAVDTVSVTSIDFRDESREAVLAPPTHPLRALWLHSWSTLAHNWIKKIKQSKEESWKDCIPHVRSALLDGFMPSSFPTGIPVGSERIFTPVDNLNAFWALYAPAEEKNSRSLLAEICSALGLAEPSAAGTDISGKVIADKIERYITQHPYVRELSLNIFKPGAGLVIAEALETLQSKQDYANLRYKIRLFTPDPDSPILGEALELLLRPESGEGAGTSAFGISRGSHLFPKLNLAKYSLEEFRNDAKKFPAHISILLDVFPAEKISFDDSRPMGITPLHGLVQDFSTEFTDDDSGVFWKKWPVVGQSPKSNKRASCFDLLSSLSQQLCYATSAVAEPEPRFKAVPVVTLSLKVPDRELIFDAHEYSDWVFTIDRNMGVEFFDHGGRKKDRSDFLIDFVPGSSSHATHNMIITSRSNDELGAMLKPVLNKHNLKADGEQSAAILANLRSLSGQLALKLISGQSQQSEALGLALGRMYLGSQEVLNNQIIMPLDAHTDLYRSRGKSNVNDAISLQRTDLGLFDLNLSKRTITCNLVEVKCSSQVGTIGALNQLKKRIFDQISQSERILQRHFDPDMKSPDRPDRLLKSRELANILSFYLERSVRYGIFDAIAAQEARSFLESIELGYSLKFTRCALIFDFDRDGTEAPDNEVNIEYHRIGKDLIQALLENCCKTATVTTEGVAENQTVSPASVESAGDPTVRIDKVHKLINAAFIAPSRERTTTWTVDDCDVGGPKEVANTTEKPAGENMPTNENESIEKVTKHVGPDIPYSNLVTIPQEFVDQIASEEVVVDIPRHKVPNKSTALSPFQEDSQVHSRHAAKPDERIDHDIMLGVNGRSQQYGLIGAVAGRKVALDLNETHTISLFGVQGGGKSYTLGSVIEMATTPLQHINVLPSPLATVIFHYSPTLDYAPEFTSMVNPNSVDAEIAILRERYRANPEGLKDVLILTPKNKVAERQDEYPDIEVKPIAFSASELKASDWKFLMGAIGSQAMYMRQINLIMRDLRGNMTLETLRAGVDNSSLGGQFKELAQTRLRFAEEYISTSQRLQEMLRPGRLIIVDLRDELIEKDEALGLFVVMLQIFSEATYKESTFSKLVVFDEAHKYINDAKLISSLIEVVREMRHKRTSIMVASQDPPSVPTALIELSTQIIMHKFNSPAWLKHIQKANASLSNLTSDEMSNLGTGEAYVWAREASDDTFTRGAVKIQCRPRVTQHGGSTKTAIGG